MRRKLITMLMLLMFTFFLASCDLFGGNDTTTTTTTTTITTTTQETTVITTAPVTTAPVTTTTETTTTETTTAAEIYYTVVFYDSDGTSILDTQQVLEGNAAVAPTSPSKPADAQYTYAFTGWDVGFSNITNDTNVTAIYSETLNSYTVAFLDEDGTILETQTIIYGSGAIAPTSPVKADAEMYTYTFTGWNVDFSNIVGELTVRAEYDRVLLTYTVTFNDEDGILIEEQVVNHGDGAMSPPNPFKVSDGSNAYQFIGWDVDISSITSDLTATATYNAVPLNTEFTVSFYDAEGMFISSESVVIGSAATPPPNPPKAADMQFTYTFAEWNNNYTNVNSNLDIYPVYDGVLNQYTVTFMDEDGVTVLGTKTVPYGSDATAPADPTKPDDIEWSYTFIGWDMSINNVQMDYTVYAVYYETSLLTFDHELLVSLIKQLFGTLDEDMDDTILEMSTILGVANEEALYNELLLVQQLFIELQLIRDAEALQTWYANVETLGFDSDRLISIFYSALLNGMTNDVGYIEEDITWTLANIAEQEAMLSNLEDEFDQFMVDVQAYCASTTEATMCLDFFGNMIYVRDLEEDFYQNMYEDEYSDGWNGDTFYYLTELLRDIAHRTYVEIDPQIVSDLEAEFNSVWSSLPIEEQQLYEPHLDRFELFINQQAMFDGADWSPLYALDNDGNAIDSMVWNCFYGYYDEYDNHIYGYLDYKYEIETYYWQIEGGLEHLDDLYGRLATNQAIVNYLGDPANEVNALTLMHTVYDALDAIILAMDQEMFDFVYGMVMEVMVETLGVNFVKGIEEENPGFPFMNLITPENIVGLAGNLEKLLLAVQSTLQPADFDNLQVVALDFLDELFTLQGMDEMSRVAMLAVIDVVMDRYIEYFEFGLGQVISFIQSVDMNKAETIMSIANLDFEMFGNPIDFAIEVVQIAEVIIGDGSIDIYQIFKYLTEIYFDAPNEFNPDATLVATTKAQVMTFITDTLALAYVVKDYHPTYISPEEVENLFDLIARIKSMSTWFELGFEHVTDPYEAYEETMLDMFLDYTMGESNIELAITRYLTVFGVPTEEDLFYTLTSIFQYIFGPVRFNGFADIQEWVVGIETFGFTEDELIGYFMDILILKMGDDAVGDQEYQDHLAFVEAQIVYFQDLVDGYAAEMDSINAAIQVYIDALDPSLQTQALDYWETYLESMMYLDPYFNMYANLEMYIGVSEALALESALLDLAWYDVVDQEYIDALAAYQAIYDAQSPENQEFIDEFETLLNIYKPASWYNADLYTILSAEPTAVAFMAAVETQRFLYINEYWGWDSATNNLYNWLTEKEWLLENLVMPLFISEFLGITANEDMVTDVIGILLDDMQNMVGEMPSDSFALLAEIVKMVQGPQEKYVPENTSEENYPEEQVPFEMPFNASEIHALIQDIVTFLDLREDSITEVEMTLIETLISTLIIEYVGTLDLTLGEATDMITMIDTLIFKYWDYAEITVTEITEYLAGLTVIDVQNLLDIVEMMTSGGSNIYESVIIISQFINSTLDTAIVDIYSIVDMYLEVYFEINYNFTEFDPQVLIDVQDAWALYIAETLTQIDAAALLNPMLPIDPLEFAGLFEIQQRVEVMGMLFGYPEGILEGISFGYTYDQLEELVYRLFGDVAWEDIGARIDELEVIFNMTEEELFYMLIGVGSAFMNMDNINSIQDISALYHVFYSLGIDNELLAEYIMNAVMSMLYPNLLNMADTSGLEADYAMYLLGITTMEAEIEGTDSSVIAELNIIVDLDMQTLAFEVWNAYLELQRSEAAFEYFQNYYMNFQNFDYTLWSDIMEYHNNENYDMINERINQINGEEQWIYWDLVGLLDDSTYWSYEYSRLNEDFNMWYGDQYTINNPSMTYLEYFESHDQLYQQFSTLFELQRQEEQTSQDINNIENNAWLLMSIHQFLSDPLNEALAEDVLVILLDEIEALLANPDINVIDFAVKFFPDGRFLMLPENEFIAEIHVFGNLVDSLFASVDAPDMVVLESFAVIMAGIFVENATDLTVQAEIDAQVLAVETIVANNFEGFFDSPALVAAFILSIDIDKLEAFIVNVEMLNYLSKEYDNDAWSVAVANLTAALFGDGSLDYDALINSVLPFLYEMSQEIGGNVLVDDTVTFIGDVVLAMDAILAQTDYVSQIDLENISIADGLAIMAFNESIDTFVMYLDSIFGFGSE